MLRRVHLNLRCDVFIDQFTGLVSSPDNMGAIHTEQGRARQVEVTNSSVLKLNRLISLIQIGRLYLWGTLRDDRGQKGPYDGITQVSRKVINFYSYIRLHNLPSGYLKDLALHFPAHSDIAFVSDTRQ